MEVYEGDMLYGDMTGDKGSEGGPVEQCCLGNDVERLEVTGDDGEVRLPILKYNERNKKMGKGDTKGSFLKSKNIICANKSVLK